jgi:hypothetical protein
VIISVDDITTVKDQEVVIDYTNWRGERRLRTIIPTGAIDFADTQWHPTRQWLLQALDPEDGKVKMFALSDIHSWKFKEKQDVESTQRVCADPAP